MGQGTTTYTIDYAGGYRVLAEETVTGTLLYLYGRECLGQYDDDGWLYYLDDATGFVRQGTDNQGTVVSAWLFDPDGLVLEGPEGPVSHLMCRGVYDWSTGLIYKDQRYFDPTLGIWLALAPLVVLQSWRGRKRRRWWTPWYVVVLCVMGVGGMLVGCGPTVPPTDTPTATATATATCTPAPTDTPGPPTPTPVPDTQLLRHSVKMHVTKEDLIFVADGPTIILHQAMPSGLGTLIAGNRIVTHNHYEGGDPSLWRTFRYIVFVNHEGKQTAVAAKDVSLPPPPNDGTRIIELAPGISLGSVTEAPLGDPKTVATTPPNNAVQVVYEVASQMRVMSTKIIAKEDSGVPVAVFEDQSKIIDEGDSGGGMFREGRLVGNTWSYVTKGKVREPEARSALLPGGL